PSSTPPTDPSCCASIRPAAIWPRWHRHEDVAMSAESSASFEIDTPVVFTTGTTGEPGHRVFYLQAQGDGLVVSLKLEKQQVGALAEYLSGLLADLPTLLDLVGPIVPEWTVGTLAVAWDEVNDRMVLVAEELLTEEEVEAAAT